MRVALQHVKKSVKVSHNRAGVFGNAGTDETKLNLGAVSEWDDVVCVMSPEEAEVVLQVLQVFAAQNTKSWKDRPAGSRVYDDDFRNDHLPPSAMIRGLESDLRKLKDQDGRGMFEPGMRADDPRWRLTQLARERARSADAQVQV